MHPQPNMVSAIRREMTVDQHVDVSGSESSISRCLALLIWGILLCSSATAAHAASVYKCVDAQGHLAYRDTPCAAQARQRKIDLQPLPTIGDASEVAAQKRRVNSASVRASSRKTHGAPRKHSTSRVARDKPETSWECRAADGEVFYRHTRCPGSVRGDGTVRRGYEEKLSSSRTRSRQDAWARVPVHGTKITRTEACRRIHSAGAAGRDGHARDEAVSTYDHLMGRDPCGD